MSVLIHTEERDGFTISTYAETEYTSPHAVFEADEADDICRRIDDGELEWFMVHVQATKCGITLADEYLGGCCYKDYADFISEGGYYSDLVEQALDTAKVEIAELSKEII